MDEQPTSELGRKRTLAPSGRFERKADIASHQLPHRYCTPTQQFPEDGKGQGRRSPKVIFKAWRLCLLQTQ